MTMERAGIKLMCLQNVHAIYTSAVIPLESENVNSGSGGVWKATKRGEQNLKT